MMQNFSLYDKVTIRIGQTAQLYRLNASRPSRKMECKNRILELNLNNRTKIFIDLLSFHFIDIFRPELQLC